MESQPQNPEFRNNPENFHPCVHIVNSSGHLRQCPFFIHVAIECSDMDETPLMFLDSLQGHKASACIMISH